MRALIRNLANKCLLATLKRNVVGEAHGIRLVSVGFQHPSFVSVVTRALDLIRTHDHRRFNRVQKHIEWIFDQAQSRGGHGSYLPRIKACPIDLQMNPDFGDHLTHAAAFAGLLVHEATHGAIFARGIEVTPQNREEVERLCYAEQNRFLRKVNSERAGLGDSLIVEYDRRFYEMSWAATGPQRLTAAVRRSIAKAVANRPLQPKGTSRSAQREK